jgi:hypothetical protein
VGLRKRLADGTPENGEGSMNLFVWLPAMFVLGLASLGICLAFVSACELI